ncbi:MAG: cysteine--tRNA ligase [Candidatus Nanohaloarchaeota archaeon QJJ-9]|nr:cysteine--tRNA ligase [Candidatus Nanohaloarchaeota archaeon QJJ-9]
MVLRFYNTMSREKEDFKPIDDDLVRIYSCGQTIYDDLHIGNARAYANWDILNRYLSWKGFDVFHVLNVTDVGHLTDDADQGEDKVEKRAKERGIEPRELVTQQLKRFYDELDKLNIKRHNVNPRATGHIHEMIEAVKDILDNGYAYERNGSVYFDVEKFHEDHGYAKMSGMDLEELQENASGQLGEEERKEKKSPLDFALWINASPEHLMKWESPWSNGYPGWHLECSVMSTKYLGEHFDIHTGGVDHIFPHHPNERAQNYAMNNLDEEPVNYWLHSEFITVNGEKMSKSEGNFVTVRDVLEEYVGEVLRMFYSSSHYRSQVDYSEEAIKNAESRLEKLYNTLWNLENAEGGDEDSLEDEIREVRQQFEEAMDDDLDSPRALDALMRFAKKANKSLDNRKELLEEVKETIQELGRVLGLSLELKEQEGNLSDELLDLLVSLRDKLREEGEYEEADRIRDSLKEEGIQLEDTDDGTVWKRS